MFSNRKVITFLLFLFSLLFPPNALAQMINEFSSGSSSDDWVELYALEDTDISGWILDDANTESNLIQFASGTIIGPSNQFLVIEVGNRLNNSGDVITLYSSDGTTVIDTIPYGSEGGVCVPEAAQSVGRVDNGNTIERLSTPTKNLTNVGSQLATCPTPTPIPTATPSPTSSPTPAPTSTPTPTPSATPTKTPTPKPTIKPTSSPDVLGESSEEVDGAQVDELRNGLATPSPTPEAEIENKKKTPIFAWLLIVVGFLFIGFSVYGIVRRHKASSSDNMNSG